jgi:hypothetical protein
MSSNNSSLIWPSFIIFLHNLRMDEILIDFDFDDFHFPIAELWDFFLTKMNIFSKLLTITQVRLLWQNFIKFYKTLEVIKVKNFSNLNLSPYVVSELWDFVHWKITFSLFCMPT